MIAGVFVAACLTVDPGCDQPIGNGRTEQQMVDGRCFPLFPPLKKGGRPPSADAPRSRSGPSTSSSASSREPGRPGKFSEQKTGF
jgi:hypothetical protein